MSNLLDQVFEFNGNRIRIAGTYDAPWFRGRDVALSLGYVSTENAIRDNVNERDKCVLKELLKNAPPTTTQFTSYELDTLIYINEFGLCSWIFGNKLPATKLFGQWVTSTLLPAIHTGAYSHKKVDELEAELSGLKQKMEAMQKKCSHLEMCKMVNDITGTFLVMNPNGISSADRVFFSNMLKNSLAFMSTPLANTEPTTSQSMKPLSDLFVEVTGEPLERNEYKHLGKQIAAAYRLRYKVKPPKVERLINGTKQMVYDSFEKKDEAWIREEIQDFFDYRYV